MCFQILKILQLNEAILIPTHLMDCYQLSLMPAIALAIDGCSMLPIAGTLAGEDTIIFVVRAGYSEKDVKSALGKEFPELIDKLL